MGSKLVEIVTEQTETLFCNMGIALRTCNIDAVVFGMPIRKHLYHTLHSLDRWYINPERYEEPLFHEPDLNSLDIPSERKLSREELIDYFEGIKAKINAYLRDLTDSDLPEKPEGCKYSRLALIFGQFRHLNCHIGIINCTTILETGKWPKVVGLAADYPKNEDEFFE